MSLRKSQPVSRVDNWALAKICGQGFLANPKQFPHEEVDSQSTALECMFCEVKDFCVFPSALTPDPNTVPRTKQTLNKYLSE